MKRKRLSIYDKFPNSLIELTINEWIHSERDRMVLRYKLIDGLTYEQIAERMDMSPKRIQTIVYNAENKLYSNLDIRNK